MTPKTAIISGTLVAVLGIVAGSRLIAPASQGRVPPGGGRPAIPSRAGAMRQENGKTTEPTPRETPGEFAGFPAAIEMALGEADPVARDRALVKLFSAWLEKDGTEPALFAEAMNPPELREEMLRRLLDAWVPKDAAQAMAWATRFPDGTGALWVSYICAKAGENDPALAIRLAIESEVEVPLNLLENLTAVWAARDGKAARAWVEGQPAGEVRDHMMARIVHALAQGNPTEAAKMVSTDIPPGDVQIEAAISVVHQWARKDLAGAEDWVSRFPDGPLRDRAAAELAGMRGGK